ncbi:sensor kinase protein [Proteus phage J3S]
MFLWLDDNRRPPEYVISTGKTYWAYDRDTFMKCINNHMKEIKEVSLDNDLGIKDFEGKDAFLIIEALLYSNNLNNLKTIYIHSHNSSAVDYMYSAKDSFKDKYNVDVILRRY